MPKFNLHIYTVQKMLWAAAVLFALLIATNAQAAVLEVGAAKKYQTITAAVAAAKDGDEIRVSKGIYKEDTIVIEKSLTLTGIDWPVIDGQQKFEMVKITGRHTIISGFVFRNSGSGNIKDIAALRIQGGRYITIQNNIFENNFFAIYLASTRHALVKGNKVTGTYKTESAAGNGIHLWKCDSITVEDNISIGHRDGIYFEFVTNSYVYRNISTQNVRYGLHFMFSDGNTYEHNHFYKNGSGVAVMYTRNIVMRYNVFDNNWGGAAYGLLLKNISRSIITNNRFTKNTVGIYVDESDKLHISNNHFSNNGWAVKIMSSSTEDTLMHNNFFVNTFDVSTSGNSNANYFYNNYWDKYRGYDLDKNSFGDVPFRPVSLFSMIMERIPNAVMMMRSLVADILDQVERVYPQVIPEGLTDDAPRMKPLQLDLPQELTKDKKPAEQKDLPKPVQPQDHDMAILYEAVFNRKTEIAQC